MNSNNSKRGGARPGAGRKKGEVSKVRLALQERARLSATEGETPLEYMLRVMRTSGDDRRRDAMATAAAPYIHPKLATVEHTGDKDKPVVMEHIGQDADAFTSRIISLAPASEEDCGAGEPN